MKLKLKNSLRVFFISMLLSCLAVSTVNAEISYIFNQVGSTTWRVMETPLPYRYIRSVHASDLGVDSFYRISNLYVGEGKVYITNGGSIVITDYEFNTQHIISTIENEGQTEVLADLAGIWVTKEGDIYVCEPSRSRIIHLDKDYNLLRILGRPEGMATSANITYQPLKVAVDNVGRIYVIANNIYEGIIEMNMDGTFSRFFGVVNVRYTAADIFWRSIQTSSQRLMTSSWLPVNFSHLTIDSDNFVYATVAGTNEPEPIRKLNGKGVSSLRFPADMAPRGEVYYNSMGQNVPSGPSLITSLDVTDYGVYYAFDSRRSRIFAYDEDGYNLFNFGESGTTKGRFVNVNDMKILDDKLVFIDRGDMSIEIYQQTEYGRSILEAAREQYNSDYRAAAVEWERVIEMNPYFQYAYVGVGKALYRAGNFEEAMEYFKIGQNAEYYSMAYQKTRQSFANDNFGFFVFILVVIVILVILRNLYKSRKWFFKNIKPANASR